jgi:hypothetical protein
MIVAAHQPNFLPWLGYFDKMAKSDVFVSVDHVQMEKQNFQNRTRIKTGDGDRWLTVPVVQRSRDELIMDKLVDNSRDGRFRWGRKASLALRYAYLAAPHYAGFGLEIERLLDRRWEKLSDLNHEMVGFLRDALKIRTPMVKSSTLKLEGSKSEMVLNLCRAVGADTYLSGAGGSRGYLDLAAFERAGIWVLWQEYAHPSYEQHPAPERFVEKLSAVDALFNCGPRAAEFFVARAFA